MALIFDTGPVYALLDRRDAAHQRCRTLVEASAEDLLVPTPILPEVDYLVRQRLGTGPMLAFLRDIRLGAFRVLELAPQDYPRVEDLIDRYDDLGLGFVDAAVIALAERLGESKVVTLDRRHFSVVRPRHVDALKLLPA